MGIEYHYESDFKLKEEQKYTDWIISVFREERRLVGELAYIFCNDGYLANINLQYLNHDTLTDIITFDYSKDKHVSGDIFISTERVKENAGRYDVAFENELKRVMIHGVLHLFGHNDKTEEQRNDMRKKEDELIKLFHVEH